VRAAWGKCVPGLSYFHHSALSSVFVARNVFFAKKWRLHLPGTDLPGILPFGWDDIAQHHCRLDLDSFGSVAWQPHWIDQPPGPPKIAFSVRGSEIAGTIVRAAGFDDRVATALDMDAKDLRFGCSACPPERDGTSSWMKVKYKWRDFVRFLLVFFVSQ